MKKAILFLMMIQLILSPISAQGSIPPAFVCQTLLEYSARGPTRETTDQKRWRLETRNHFLDFIKHHSTRGLRRAEADQFRAPPRPFKKIIGVTQKTRAEISEDELDPLISAANALDPYSNAIEVSAWHTTDRNEMEQFRSALIEARDRLIPFHEKRHKQMIPRLKIGLRCGEVISFVALALAAWFHSTGIQLSIYCFVSGLSGLVLSSRIKPDQWDSGLEVNDLDNLSSAVDVFGKQLDSQDQGWAYLYLNQGGVHFLALTFSPVIGSQKLVVATYAEPEALTKMDSLQRSFESHELVVSSQSQEIMDGGKP